MPLHSAGLSGLGTQMLLGPGSCVRSLNLSRCHRLTLKALSFLVLPPAPASASVTAGSAWWCPVVHVLQWVFHA